MELLESAMAFAVAMILFSTIATGIVELAFRIFGMREKTLATTVETLFDAVIWPRLKGRLLAAAASSGTAPGTAPGTETEKEALRLCFLRDMTGNPAVRGVFDGGSAGMRVPIART